MLGDRTEQKRTLTGLGLESSPATTASSIVAYYARRKIMYHFVRFVYLCPFTGIDNHKKIHISKSLLKTSNGELLIV